MRKGKKNKSAGQRKTVRRKAPRGAESPATPKVKREHDELIEAATVAQRKHQRTALQFERSVHELRIIRRQLSETLRQADAFMDYTLDARNSGCP